MRRALALSLLSLLAFAAPAVAEVRPGTVDDPDAATNGGPNLLSAGVDYDTAGAITARLTFDAAPPASSDALAAVVLGSRSFSGTCQTAFAFGSGLGSASTTSRWSVGASGAAGDGSRSLAGATLTIQASDPALAGDLDCFAVRVVRASDGEVVYDLAGTVDLKLPDGDGDGVVDREDKCPAQAAPGQSDGCAPAPPPAPAPAPAPDPVPPLPKATSLEKYDAAVAKCPTKKGSKRTACLSRAKKSYKSGYALARKRATNRFLGKAFFRPDIDVGGLCGGACLTGMVFVDDKWAYRGEPEDGPILVRCAKVTAVGDGDGCLRYTLSKDRRSARVAGVAYRFTNGGKQITPSGDNGGPLTRVAIPAAGTRVNAVIDNISSFGITGVNQTFSTSELTFAADGRFVGAGTASGSTGQGDFQSTFTAIGPERRGRYAFEPGGTLSFTYDDGRVIRRSAFVAFGPKATLGNIARDGLFLDGSFYDADD